MAYVNVAEWNPEHVADWLRGLEDEIQPYTQFFVNNKVNGCQLLTLARDDLTNLNMTKIGHQELVLEAVELLRQLHYNLTSETLQSLALKLGCKAQSLFNDLKRVVQDFADTGKKERVAAATLSAVSDIINLVKSLISWLDRYPFVGQESYSDVRKTILKLSVELASTAQRDQFAENPHKIIKETCLKLAAQSDKIVQEFNDSLIIQPASLEVAKIKRKIDDDVGIHINSLYTGIHIIEDIKFQRQNLYEKTNPFLVFIMSPAYRSGKVEEGDEIVQVNYQTVIGWQVKNIICAMKEHPTEVHLTLKKRPRHPNVLGQVITLWPYRIPSKKTAFRKLYKWNKGKDIRDLCPKSPGTRGEANSVSEVNGGLVVDKEKLFAVNKPRNRLRRRATVTGVSPTTLHAPVSLEELIGGNSKRKESVLRTISYDPNKTVDLEDNVFKRDLQTDDQDNKQETESTKPQEVVETVKVESKEPKSPFLRPPQEKFNIGHLRRQEALKNSETVARAGVAKSVPVSVAQNVPPPKPPLRPPMQQQNATTDASVIQDTVPSGSQSPKSKLADWVNKQKKKPEVGLLQHALTLFSQDSTTAPPSSPKESGSPQSPRSTGSPKTKKSSGNMFQFPFREGRPSLSELRGLKRAANTKVFSERVSSTQSDKSATSPKHSSVQKRNQMMGKKTGLVVKPTKESVLNHPSNGETWKYKDIPKLPDNYIHPKCINYAKIPQYPYEMHESKIVSLKSRMNNNNISQANIKPNVQTFTNPPRNNLQHYQRAKQMAKLTSQNPSSLIRNPKTNYPKTFYSPSGRSLSFNNLVVNSDDSSSEEEYEIYEELIDDSQPIKQAPVHNVPPSYSEVDPHFTRQVAEVYSMLAQRQNFLQSQMNGGGYRGQVNVPNPAVIDELALRMYHALRMNHMKAQNSYQQQRVGPVPELKNTAALKNIAMRNIVPPKKPPKSNHYPAPHPVQKQHPPHSYNDEFHPEKPVTNSVTEHPVDLPPSAFLPSRNGNHHVFKSATSQEIHNLYTSRTSNKGSVSTPYDNEKGTSYPDEQNEKDHMYETIPYQKTQCIDDIQNDKCDEKVFLYPAEKEFEPELPCKDNDIIDNRIPEHNLHVTANPNFKSIKDNVFCPIKENISLKSHHFDNCSAFKPVAVNRDKNQQTFSNSSQMNYNGNDEDQRNNFINMYDKDIQPAISSLIMNIPKPPSEAYSPTATKCSSSQTDDSELCDSVEIIPDEKQSDMNSTLYFSNDESFNSLNCTNNSVNESHNFSSSSSLNSSSSGSTISSSGSCYYYVETQIKPQYTYKCQSVTSENGEDVPLIDLRSPTLPTMGVSMLSKKRSTSSSGSEHSSNAGSRASPNVPVIIESDVSRSTRIVTDVEHTI